MATKGTEPGNPDSAPIESRRTPAAADRDAVAPEEQAEDEAESSVIDMPDMGTFTGESARPTPLDDIAGAERSKLPID